MELHQIRYFLTLCQTLNFTRAAEQCHVSQPSLTRAVKKLEDELGGDLFRRERSRTHLTDLGRTMMPYLQQSLDGAMAAKTQAESYGKGEVAPLHLGVSSTIEIRLLLPALCELARAMPGLQLRLTRKPAPEAMQQLENGDTELCITALDKVSWERIDQWPLFTEDFVLLANNRHPLGSAGTIEIAALQGQQIVVRPYCEQAGKITTILQQQGVPLGEYHELTSDDDLSALVGGGIGLGITPRSTQTPNNVAAVPINLDNLERTVSLFAVSGRQHSRAAACLIRLLRAADWSKHQVDSSQSSPSN